METAERISLAECTTRHSPAPRKGQTVSGYGPAIPTDRMVKVPGADRWRRVYVTCYGNAGSAWITVAGRRVYVDD